MNDGAERVQIVGSVVERNRQCGDTPHKVRPFDSAEIIEDLSTETGRHLRRIVDSLLSVKVTIRREHIRVRNLQVRFERHKVRPVGKTAKRTVNRFAAICQVEVADCRIDEKRRRCRLIVLVNKVRSPDTGIRIVVEHRPGHDRGTGRTVNGNWRHRIGNNIIQQSRARGVLDNHTSPRR